MLKRSFILAVSVCVVICALRAGDFTIDTQHADGFVSWKGTKLVRPVFRVNPGTLNHFKAQSRKRVDRLPDGRTVTNFICDSPTPWRVETAIDPAGNEVECTFGTGCKALFPKAGGRTFELRIPWKSVAGKKYKLFLGKRNGIKAKEGVFDDKFQKISWVRYIAIGDGKTPGPVLDLNPRGTTAYDSDQWTTTNRGSWILKRDKDDLVFYLSFNLAYTGNYFGAKFRFFTGVFDDYYRRHARLHYEYMSKFLAKYILSFGSARHGKAYTSADGKPFDAKRGFGWLNGFTPEFVTESPEGAYYSHAKGNSPAVFRMANLNPGFYVVNIGAGNLKGEKSAFTVKLNGENMTENFTLPAGKACDLTRVVHVKDGKIDVAFSGSWKLSTIVLQPLLHDLEDFVFYRGMWLIDEKEPLTGVSSNASVKAKPVFPVGTNLYTLPVPGKEAAAARKPFVRESALPDTSIPEAQWQKNIQIASFGENLTSMAALQTAGAVEKTIDRFRKLDKTFLIHNGIFSRHLYAREAAETEIPVLKHLCDEAHRKGMRILDHQDYSLLWDCGTGFRTLTEQIPAVQHSIFDHRIHTAVCPNNPAYRKYFFDRTLKLIRETGLDAIMVDEVGFFSEADCCGCAYCREDFHKETGWYLPVNELSPELKNPASPLWRTWKEYQKKKAGDWWVALRKAIMPIRPDFLFMTYCTHRYFVEGWTSFERLRSGTFYGTEILNPNVFNSARSTFSYRKLKNLIPACYGASVMGLVYGGSDYVIAYSGWAMNTMNAQDTWFLGSNPQFSFLKFKGGMDRMKAKPIRDCAILFSRDSQSGKRNPDIWSNSWLPGKMMGLAQTLDAMHVPYGFIDESQLTQEKLAPFKAVLIPAAPVLSDEALKVLDSYVQNGGTLMITSYTGTMKDLGTKRNTRPFMQYFGTEPKTLAMSPAIRMNGKALTVARPVYFFKLKNNPRKGVKVHLCHEGIGTTPMVLETAVGKGKIFWFNAELFRGIYEEEWFHPGNTYGFKLDEVQNRIVQTMLKKIVDPYLSCRITAPEKVLTSHYTDGNKVWLHFFNHTGFNLKKGAKMPWTWPKDSFPQLKEPIQIVLNRTAAKAVYATSPDFAGRKNLAFAVKDGKVSFALPVECLKTYTVVTAE